MEHTRQYAGPETAWYGERLRRKRRFELISGFVILVFGLCILITGFLLVPESARELPAPLVLIAISLLPILQGGSLLLANWGPVTRQAVEQLRRQERTQLFRQAQGMMLPWQYRRRVRILEGFFGLLLLSVALYNVFAAPMISSTDVRGWIFLLMATLPGFLLIIDSIFVKPWRVRRLVKRSATELASRLSLGELVTGNPEDADDK